MTLQPNKVARLPSWAAPQIECASALLLEARGIEVALSSHDDGPGALIIDAIDPGWACTDDRVDRSDYSGRGAGVRAGEICHCAAEGCEDVRVYTLNAQSPAGRRQPLHAGANLEVLPVWVAQSACEIEA